MIVKVQISLHTTADEPQVLITDKPRKLFTILPLSAYPGLEDAMVDAGSSKRAFFEAKIVDGKVQIGDPLPEQGW